MRFAIPIALKVGLPTAHQCLLIVVEWELDVKCRPGTRRALQRECTADRVRPVLQPEKSRAPSWIGSALAVVANAHMKLADSYSTTTSTSDARGYFATFVSASATT